MLRKKITKSKIGSKGFNLTKIWFHLTKISNQSPMFILFIYLFSFFCTSNFLALIILQPETVKLNVTKSYILKDVVGFSGLVQPAFLCAKVVNLVLWIFYMNHEL